MQLIEYKDSVYNVEHNGLPMSRTKDGIWTLNLMDGDISFYEDAHINILEAKFKVMMRKQKLERINEI